MEFSDKKFSLINKVTLPAFMLCTFLPNGHSLITHYIMDSVTMITDNEVHVIPR